MSLHRLSQGCLSQSCLSRNRLSFTCQSLTGLPMRTRLSIPRPFRPRLVLTALVLAAACWAPAALAAVPSPDLLRNLETALNSGSSDSLAALLKPGGGLDPADVEARYRSLRTRFPDARWQISPGENLKDGRSTVRISVSGSSQVGAFLYRLQAEQLLALNTRDGRLDGQELIAESATLRSGSTDLPVSVLIPDAVLTGQRYDVDVVFDNPLDWAVAAGGIAAVTEAQIRAFKSPDLELAALGGGGVFKVVQAPQQPGSQTWAVLLVHPDGIVSTTKRVRVVGDRAALKP